MAILPGVGGVMALALLFVVIGELSNYFIPQVGRKRGYSLSGYTTLVVGVLLLDRNGMIPKSISQNLILLILAISLTGVIAIAVSRRNPQIYLTLFSSPVRFLTELGIASGVITIVIYLLQSGVV